jgi:hypothetical protein
MAVGRATVHGTLKPIDVEAQSRGTNQRHQGWQHTIDTRHLSQMYAPGTCAVPSFRPPHVPVSRGDLPVNYTRVPTQLLDGELETSELARRSMDSYRVTMSRSWG